MRNGYFSAALKKSINKSRNSSGTVMSNQYGTLVSSLQNGLTQNPDQGVVYFSVASRGEGGLHRTVKVREFEVDVDEPPSLGGHDKAANPVEFALVALATCQEISYHLHAAALGIPLNDVSVQLRGSLDLRGFFATDPTVRPGFQDIQGSVKFDSSASHEQLAALKESVDRHCPVLDLFRHPTPVNIVAA
jgi:uncharacterized OsmC-like protein